MVRKLKKQSLKEKIVKLLPNGEAEITYTDGTEFFRGPFVSSSLNTGPDIEKNKLNNAKVHPKYQVNSTKNIIYREATLKDKNDIIDLRFLNFFDEDYGMISAYQSLEQKFNIEAGYVTILAIDETYNLVVGQIYGLPMGKSYYIDDVFVAQSYRKNGIGKKLIELFEEKVRKRLPEITLMVINKKEKADNTKEFYKQLGYKVTFEKTEKMRNYYRYDMKKV